MKFSVCRVRRVCDMCVLIMLSSLLHTTLQILQILQIYHISKQSASFPLEDFIRYNEDHRIDSSDGGYGSSSSSIISGRSSSSSSRGSSCGLGEVPTTILLNARPVGPICIAQTNKSSQGTVCVSRYVCLACVPSICHVFVLCISHTSYTNCPPTPYPHPHIHTPMQRSRSHWNKQSSKVHPACHGYVMDRTPCTTTTAESVNTTVPTTSAGAGAGTDTVHPSFLGYRKDHVMSPNRALYSSRYVDRPCVCMLSLHTLIFLSD